MYPITHKEGFFSMSDNIFRIVVTDGEYLAVNMVYQEIDDEVMGAFSGDGGGGLFHQNADGEFTVSDDFGEFDSQCMDYDALEARATNLEKLRAEFESYNEDGDLEGLSSKGDSFVQDHGKMNNGLTMSFSEDARDDFIYDVQDEWNLNFYLD